MTPRTLALTNKHLALVQSVPDGDSVAPAVTESLGEFIELCRELEATNAGLLAVLQDIAANRLTNAWARDLAESAISKAQS